MVPRIDLITILTDDVPALVAFYRDVLGFAAASELGQYVEFETEGVRFAICARSILLEATDHGAYRKHAQGLSFELAFPCTSPADVDATYERIVAGGAAPITAPADMPWGQRTAFFADPDGNVHEIFASLPTEGEAPEA
jgi:catechol 2,3-dioxygenase-like lactoylglutathione lyase family enzyme